MNTLKGRDKFKNFIILLDSGYSSTFVMGRITQKINLKEDAAMQWHTQAGRITTNLKVNI